MKLAVIGALAVGLGGIAVWAADDEVTFHSDVSLVRVDVQVLDSGGGAITGLTADDFELRDNGKRVAIRNFVREEMPLDVLFLLDVSGSMQPHIQSVARASKTALNELGDGDRVAIMVFDRATRIRSPFKPAKDAYREMERVIDQESFNGGTDVTGGIKDAINYMSRQGRREGRRAIIIVTDDQTEFQSDVPGMVRLLTKNDIVFSALIAPDAMGNHSGFPGGIPGTSGRRRGSTSTSTWPGGGGWPGSSGGGFPGGGTWPGSTGGGGGRRLPGGVQIGGGMPNPAGSPEIAVQSGGDSFPVGEADALQTTLERLRQRYALFFHAPAGSREGEERTIDVALVGNGLRRYRNAELKFRKSYIATDVADDGSAEAEPPAAVTSSTDPAPSSRSSRSTSADRSTSSSNDPDSPRFKRRPAVSEPAVNGGPNPNVGGGWRTADPKDQADAEPVPAAVSTKPVSTPAPASPAAPATQSGGWRRATPDDTK